MCHKTKPKQTKNLYSLLMFSNKTLMQYLEQTYKHVLTKMQQDCGKNKLVL